MNFEHYSWLIGIPIALALASALFLSSARARKKLVRRFVSDRLVQQLLASYSPLRRRFKISLLLIALTLIIFALARPQWGYTWQESKSKGIDIMFVVDVSRSMLAQDIKPNRLERSKLAILDFLDRLEGDRVGLVAFAGNAFLQCPLTLDYDAFRQSLEAINTDVISLGGTDIARAITEAEAAFSDKNNYKILVMITDGEDLEEDGIVRAREAADNGITIYTVGVGTPEGELIPVQNRFGQTNFLRDDNGDFVRTQLDADTLQEIAEVTDGFYAPLGPTGYGLDQVYEAGLKSIPEQELASRMEKAWIERYQWPLGLAIILLAWEPLIGTRRSTLRRKANANGVVKNTGKSIAKAATWLLLAGLTLSGGDLWASVRQGEKLFQSGDYASAAEAFKAALEADPLNAQASFNLGNAMEALGKNEEAQAAYARALATTDLDLQADAFYNLGSLKFTASKEKLAEADLPAAAQLTKEASQNVAQAIQQGRKVLAQSQGLSNSQLPSQPGSPSPQQMILQEAQQALQFAEQAETAGKQAVESSSAAQKVGKPVMQVWEQAANDFKSSLELNPTGDDAAHNYDYIQRQTEDLKRDLHELNRSAQSIETKQPELAEVIEELKKLIEEQQQNQQNQQQDQQQQNQNQQQQNQQDQQNQQSGEQQQQDQQNQQQQSQQQQGSSNQDQQEQAGEQDPTQADSKEDAGKSSDAEENSQESKDEAQELTDEEKREQAAKNESEKEGDHGEDGAQKDQQSADAPARDSSEVDEMIDAMQQGQEAQTGEEDAQADQEKTPKEGESQPMTLSEEDAAKLQEQAAAQAAKMEDAAGEPTEGAAPLGVMTRDDARRLLESLKRYEKKLPVSGYGRRESNRDDEGKRKDW